MRTSTRERRPSRRLAAAAVVEERGGASEMMANKWRREMGRMWTLADGRAVEGDFKFDGAVGAEGWTDMARRFVVGHAVRRVPSRVKVGGAVVSRMLEAVH